MVQKNYYLIILSISTLAIKSNQYISIYLLSKHIKQILKTLCTQHEQSVVDLSK